VHCELDLAIKLEPSLSPFYMGLEPHLNKLIACFGLEENEPVQFKFRKLLFINS